MSYYEEKLTPWIMFGVVCALSMTLIVWHVLMG